MRGYLLRKHLHHVLEVSTDGNKYEELNEDHLLQFLDEVGMVCISTSIFCK